MSENEKDPREPSSTDEGAHMRERATRDEGLALVDDALFDQHRSRGYHPERPERLEAARRAVARSTATGPKPAVLGARDATDEEIARAHAPSYVETLAGLAGRHAALDADTFLAPASVAAARRAAGGAIALVDALVDGSASKGVALLRPPGHHATDDRGMGFCLLNNAAIAARHAVRARGLERVAILDWDVHHGNGTQDIFWSDPHVLYLSLHQYPLYPGTGAAREAGAGEGRGYTVNIPLSADANDAVYSTAFDSLVLPVIDEYKPELILVSAGFDAHTRDPLGGMLLTEAGYAAMTRGLTRAAEKSAKGRIALLLEGGYDLSAIEGSLAASIDAMLGRELGEREAIEAEAPADGRHESELDAARQVARSAWIGL
jgi:acetoin utilization deacetylase AcuC-like enzyme